MTIETIESLAPVFTLKPGDDGRHRIHVDRTGERATKGRKRAFADWLRDFYRSQLRGMRRQDRRAKLGRYTAGRQG